MREYANYDIKSIIDEIGKHLDSKTHKSALEVLQILTDNKDGSLKEMSKEDWFVHYEFKIDELVYSDRKFWNTEGFKILFDKFIPMIHFQIQRAYEK
ncbi:MAG TPA: hypothetical protein PKX92_13660 [Edaphocola sp.]|nr:hypothetical protein [Edaphocola sp.]